MSYVKQNFTDGQTLKASHLNSMENALSDTIEKYGVTIGNMNCLFIGKAFCKGTRSVANINPDSANRVTMTDVVTIPYRKARLKFHLPDHYLIGIRYGNRADRLSGNDYWYGGVPVNEGNYNTGSTQYKGNIFSFPHDVTYYGLTFTRDIDDAGNSIPVAGGPESGISPEEILRLVESGEIYVELLNNETTDIISRNADNSQYLARQIYSNFKQGGTLSNTNRPFQDINDQMVIAHITDIHGDAYRARNFYQYANYIGADLCLVTGDSVSYSPESGLEYLKTFAKESAVPTCYCTGNHDVYYRDTEEKIYNDIIKGFEEQGGYKIAIDANGKKCAYYHIDNAEFKTRVIALNLYDGGQTGATVRFVINKGQINWLINTLKSTPAGYGIIVISHAPECSTSAKISGKGSKFYQDVTSYWDSGYKSGTAYIPLIKILDAFVGRTTVSYTYENCAVSSSSENGSATVSFSADFSDVDPTVELIGHFNGHTHQDFIGYYTEATNKVLCVNSTCGIGTYGNSAYRYLADNSDLPRGNIGKTQDAFNIYVVDRTRKILKVARIGSNVTYDDKLRDYMEISYAN